jgi:LuxR family maltose regulon positive regulatory protein
MESVPIPLLRTKLFISPLRPEIVPRPHLIARLDGAIKSKLTLISAPAGFGKTTLLKEWIEGSDLRVAWVSLDPGDNDPLRFWAYVAAALQSVHKGMDETIASSLQSNQPPPLEYLLTDLINAISKDIHYPGQTDAPARKIILVLDDYHVITELQVHETLTFFLDHLPPQLHLIISGRADPPWHLARMRARLKMIELRAEDLRFQLDEAALFLNQVMDLNISSDDIEALEQQTEGWIVGLQMAALSMRSREDKSEFIRAFTGTHRFILDYLLEEVLNQQPGDIEAFLLKSSILEQMSVEMCDFVLERTDSQSILMHLEQTNLFVIPLDDERCWYRYHHLFSELLRSQLTLKYPDQVSILHQKASQWFENHNFREATINHAFAANDYERVARLIEKYAQGLLQETKHSAVSNWIEALPPDLVLKHPWLCVYKSWTRHWAGLRDGGEDCLKHAERSLDERSILSVEDRRIIPGYIAMVRSHYALTNEALTDTIEQAQKALRLLPENDYFARSTAGISLGGAYWGNGDVWQSERAFAECASAALKGSYPHRASSALCYVGMQQVKQARLLEARDTFLKSLGLVEDSERRRFPNAGYPLAKLGELALEWNNLEEAYENTSRAVDLCTQLGHVDLIAEAYAALARVQLARREYGEVEQILGRTDQLSLEMKLDPWATTWLDDCRIRLWLSTGKLEETLRWIHTSQLKIDGKLNFQHELKHIILARILVAQAEQGASEQHLRKTERLLKRLLDAASTAGWLHHKIQILVLMARAYQEQSKIEQALIATNQALTLAEGSKYIRVFIEEGPKMGELLSGIQDGQQDKDQSAFQRKQASYINSLLTALEKKDPSPKTKAENELIEPLTSREMDVLRLLVTNMTVPEIADELVVTANTVRSHVKRIYEKLEVHRRLSAVEKAKELKLV